MSRHLTARFIACLDGIALVGQGADIQDAQEDLAPPSKIRVPCQRFAIQGPAGRRLAVGGAHPRGRLVVKILGAALIVDGVGIEGPKKEASGSAKSRQVGPFSDLPAEQGPPGQSKIPLLRATGIPRMQHLLRANDPRRLFPACLRFGARAHGMPHGLRKWEGARRMRLWRRQR
eukprot:gene1237-biopygen880